MNENVGIVRVSEDVGKVRLSEHAGTVRVSRAVERGAEEAQLCPGPGPKGVPAPDIAGEGGLWMVRGE